MTCRFVNAEKDILNFDYLGLHHRSTVLLLAMNSEFKDQLSNYMETRSGKTMYLKEENRDLPYIARFFFLYLHRAADKVDEIEVTLCLHKIIQVSLGVSRKYNADYLCALGFDS